MVSESLLESIFDPHSIGHDGAVIINGNRVAMFGCHLPLSMNISRYGNLGLRHTAALGLAERSNALCIVVSEERGTISLAYQEKLTAVNNTAALQEALEQYYIRNAPAKKSSSAAVWLKENTLEKVIAIVLACILWVAFGYQRELIRRDFIIPIEYKNVPAHWKIDEPQITEAKVIFQGPAQAFQLLNDRSLKVSLDLSPIAEKKREFTLTKDMVNAPSNLSIAEITPGKIHVYASRLSSYTLPVYVNTRNYLPDNLSLQKILITPPTVKVLIDSRLSPEQVRIETEPIDLQKINTAASIDAKIILPAGVFFPEGKAPAARIAIKVKKKSP
jgi:YbbR domain-containing protein